MAIKRCLFCKIYPSRLQSWSATPPATVGTDRGASRPVCAYKKTAIPSMMELPKHLINKEQCRYDEVYHSQGEMLYPFLKRGTGENRCRPWTGRIHPPYRQKTGQKPLLGQQGNQAEHPAVPPGQIPGKQSLSTGRRSHARRRPANPVIRLEI